MQPDSILNSRYRVIYAVDERPTGVTLRARDEQDDTLVLLSLIPVNTIGSSDIAALARQIATVQHELLLPLRDHFADEGRYVLVCIDPGGPDIERSLRARGEPQPEQETLAQATQLLQLLDLLHQQKPPLQIGDLWPSDVLSANGNWRVTPFPLARMVSPTPSPYRAPELANPTFEPATTTDTYAISALLYQALCGVAPPTPEQQQAGTPLTAPRTLNQALSPLMEQTLLRGLQLKPANRYQNARELRLALETVHLMAGRSLGLGPDILKSPEIIAATAASTGASQALVDVPVLPPAIVAAAPTAAVQADAPAQYVYEPLPAAAAPPRKGLSTGCLIGLALGLAALVIAIAVALVFVLTTNGMFGSVFGRSAASNTSRAVAVPLGPNAITAANVTTITQTATITSEMFGPIAYAPTNSNQLAIGIGSAIRLAGADLREQRLISGQSGNIVAVSFSPDGKLLASTAQGDNDAQLWDVASGKLLRTLAGHTGWLRSVAFSPDGKLLATGSTDTNVKLWNVADGRLLTTLSGHKGWVGTIAFAPDGTSVAASSRDGTVLVWNTADGTPRTSFAYTNQVNPQTNQAYYATGLAYTPDGKRMAVGGFDGSIALLDAATGKVERRLTGHTDYIVLRGLAFSPDGKTLYSTSADGTVRAWNVAVGSELGQFEGHGLVVIGLALSPDGKRLASISSEEGTIIVWDTATRNPVTKFISEQGLVTNLAYTLDGSGLGMTSYSGALRLRLSDGRQSTVGAPGSAMAAVFLTNAQLAVMSDQDELRLVRANANSNQVLRGLDGKPRSLATNRTGTLIVAGSTAGKIVVWDAQGNVRTTISSQVPVIRLLTVSDDGRYLAVGGTAEVSQVELWQINDSARLVETLAGPRNGLNALAFAPDNKRLAATDRAGELFLWDVATTKLITLKQAASDQLRYSALAFSPDSKLLVGGALNGEIVAWNGEDGSDIGKLAISRQGVIALAFSPDGQQLAASVRDEQASVLMLGVKK